MRFRPTKNGLTRNIPFSRRLADILKEAKKMKQENENRPDIHHYRPVRLENGFVTYKDGNAAEGEILDFVCTKNDGRCLGTWDFKAISSIIQDKFDKDFTFHSLRHSYVTIALDAGASLKSVQYTAGHKDIRTTLGVYAHVSDKALYDTAERIEQCFDDDGLKLVRPA